MTEPNTLSCTICTKVTPVQVNYNGKNYCIDHVPNTDTLDEQIEAILDWFWDCVVDHYEGKPQGGNFSTKAIVKLKTLFTEHSKGAEIRARMKQLRKDRQHEIDVWESDRNAGYYEQELKQLKAQLKRNK